MVKALEIPASYRVCFPICSGRVVMPVPGKYSLRKGKKKKRQRQKTAGGAKLFRCHRDFRNFRGTLRRGPLKKYFESERLCCGPCPFNDSRDFLFSSKALFAPAWFSFLPLAFAVLFPAYPFFAFDPQ